MDLALDHVLTYAAVPDIEAYMASLRSAGFAIWRNTARHEGGLRNGYFSVGAQYVELCCVEDEPAFRERPSPIARADVRADPRPFALALRTSDIEAVRSEWSSRVGDLPPALDVKPVDMSVTFHVQLLPESATPGALLSAIEYPPRPDPPRPPKSPNTLDRLVSVTLVADRPRDRCARWAASIGVDVTDATSFRLGAHRFTWLDAREFARRYDGEWRPARHALGEIAALEATCSNLGQARRMLAASGWSTRDMNELIVVDPDPSDGLRWELRRP